MGLSTGKVYSDIQKYREYLDTQVCFLYILLKYSPKEFIPILFNKDNLLSGYPTIEIDCKQIAKYNYIEIYPQNRKQCLLDGFGHTLDEIDSWYTENHLENVAKFANYLAQYNTIHIEYYKNGYDRVKRDSYELDLKNNIIINNIKDFDNIIIRLKNVITIL